MIKKVRTKNLKGLIEEHRKEKKLYKTYEFDSDSYMALLCDINDLLHQLEEKDKIINEIKKLLKEDNISYAYESLESSYLDHETLLELLEILEGDKNGVDN